jgi:DNA-binding transcriptional MerR regulator
MTKNTMSIGELSTASGLSTHTLRYYEKLGVLKPADRAASGHRQYRADAVAWLDFVLRLKITGMPLAEIRKYAQLRVGIFAAKDVFRHCDSANDARDDG